MEALNAVKPYEFHGLVLSKGGDNAKGSCPFCDKDDHFFINRKTGQYNCRRCAASGNIYTFIEALWESAHKTTKHVPLQKLANERGLDLEEMLRWGVRCSRIDGAFLLPMHNTKGKFSNLARIVKSQGKWVVYGTPTCKLHPFGTNLLNTTHKYLWVAEGPWDAIALSYALHNVRKDHTRWIAHTGDKIASRATGVIAAPGATNFAAEWLQYFNERKVLLAFDNDHPTKQASGKSIAPGPDGMKRIIKLCEENEISSKIQYLAWGPKGYDPGLPSGHDIRDLSKTLNPQQLMSFLCSRMKKVTTSLPEKNGHVEAPSLSPLDCKTFNELCEHFAEHLYFPHNMRLALAVCLATVASTNLAGEQLWFRVIGPPGSGKTTLAECISVAREYCFPKSILTGFHSGMRKSKNSGGKEPSLVPMINGKCVVIKDADTLLNAGNKDKILSELRDIYDGSSRTQYRTGKSQDFENLRNTFLLCGTDALRSLNRSFLGERFLDCDILGDSSTSEYLDSAMSSAFAAVGGSLSGSEATGAHSTILKQVTYGYLLHLIQCIKDKKVAIPSVSPKTQNRLKAMALLLSYTRARVERDGGEMSYRPRPELATRLIKQFAKLAICLSLVFGKATVDEEVMEIVHKVLMDTSHGYEYEIIERLYNKPLGQSAVQLENDLGLSVSTIRRICDDSQELGITERHHESNHSGVGGRHAHLWFLSREVRDVFKTSKGL